MAEIVDLFAQHNRPEEETKQHKKRDRDLNELAAFFNQSGQFFLEAAGIVREVADRQDSAHEAMVRNMDDMELVNKALVGWLGLCRDNL